MRKVASGRYKKGRFGVRTNKFGVKFTASEYKRYKELNRIVERKRKRLERKGVKRYGSDYKNYYGKQATSLHIYESKAEFKAQMKRLESYASEDYIRERDQILFDNYKQKVAEVFGNQEAYEQMMNLLDEMTTSEFITAYQDGDIDDIRYLYSSNSKYLGAYEEQQLIEQAQKVVGQLGG